jgi:hypothetical protein
VFLPDVAVPAEQALERAYELALEHLGPTAADRG